MTSAPDYVLPIIGYRVWQWDLAGLRSLNGEPWQPGGPLEARCMVSEFAAWRTGHNAGHNSHSIPQLKCTCGIHARKDQDGLRQPMHGTSLIYGQVSLWGTMVEHQYGWRAQYAYPKSFSLSPDVLPVTLLEIGARLETLARYHCDIFILQDGAAKLPLWKHDSGLDGAGLNYLTRRASRWYTQRNQSIVRGDRVAVLGRGIAVVEEIRGEWTYAVLGKENVRITSKQISWNRQNDRWEAEHTYTLRSRRNS